MQARILPLVAAVAALAPALAAPLQDLQSVPVLDINSRPAGRGYDPEWLTAVGDRLFFSAYTDIGYELWATDGTQAGTTLVKDIAPINSSVPSALVALGDTLLFSAYEGMQRELWRSDGTEAGTVRVHSIDPGLVLTAAGDLVYFVADDGVHGRELWASDGTEAGTGMVVDLAPGPGHANIAKLVDVDGMLYFARRFGTSGSSFDVWRSDGTAAGTLPVVEFGAGSNSNVNSLMGAAGALYFVAAIDGDRELWKHDPATGMTIEIDVNPLTGSYPNELTEFDGTLFFRASVDYDDELWRLDGETPVQVKNIHPTGSSLPQRLTVVTGDAQDTLFFSADDGLTGRELWKTDGTEAGTLHVADLNPAGDGIELQVFFGGPPELAAVGGMLFFTGNDGGSRQAWRSDGTAAGTIELEVNSIDDANPLWIVDFDGTACFAARDGIGELSTEDFIFGYELWTSDGTPGNTVAIELGAERTLPSMAVPQRLVGSTLYFIANDGEIELTDSGDHPTNYELWRTDGTAAGTTQVADIHPGGSAFRLPTHFAFGELDGLLLFSADDGVTGRELWRSDGTEAGTTLVKDIRSGSPDAFPLDFTTVGGEVLFAADDGVNGRELWKTDGTEAGTLLVADIAPGSATSFPQQLADFDGALFFSANDGQVGAELWRSDGTTAGTTLVQDIQPGSAGANPRDLTVVGDTLFFRANNTLWKSDGTGAGTVRIVEVSAVIEIAAADGVLYFSATGDASGYELWRHDPATDVTERVTDVHPTGNSYPQELLGFDGALFFEADDGVHGAGLWKYDPSTDSTESIAQFDVPGDPRIDNLTVVSGTLYFTAIAGGPIPKRDRSDLWKSDGTVAGTRKMGLGLGISPSPLYLMDLGGRLVFRGRRYDVSTELFKLAGTPSLAITSPAEGAVIDGAEVLVDGIATDDGIVVSVVVNEVEAALVPSGNTDDPAEVLFSALVSLEPGPNELSAVATDDDGNTSVVTIVVESEQDGGAPPDCSDAAPSQAQMWPPNHKWRKIRILGVDDGDCDSGVHIEITGVTSDECTMGPGHHHDPDAVIPGDGTVLLRSERFGFGNGRVYRIHYTASNDCGECSGSVDVAVPHDQSGDPAIDDGQNYDATGGD